jgi:hypothetical protein
MPGLTPSAGPDPNCPKCGGTGWHSYDRNHSTVCNACCPHDQGWWLLREHYGENNGKWCCRRGCGKMHLTKPEETTI